MIFDTLIFHIIPRCWFIRGIIHCKRKCIVDYGIKPNRITACQTISLQAPLSDSSASSVLEDMIADDTSRDPEHELARKVLYERLYEMLETLPEREQQIIILRFGLFDNRPLPLAEVSTRFNLTKERIRQLEIQILGNMRKLAQNNFFDGVPQIS